MASSTCSCGNRALTRALLAAACSLALAALTGAQQQQPSAPPEHPDVHSVAGRVLRPAAGGLIPVSGLWVVLHRLGSDRAGPLDSVRTDARGAYRFSYRPAGDERALYFVAASHGGVAYFTPPLVDHSVAGEAAEIVVYDTTTRDIPISIRGRHLVVSAADAGDRRMLMEVYELSNDTNVTRISPLPGSPPTWRTLVPASARDFRVPDGDVPADAVQFEGGEVRLVAPLPPGVKQLAYSYTLPVTDFPLSVPLLADTELLEVLIEDPAGTARGAQLGEVSPVTVEGRGFRRFLARDVQRGAVSVIDIPRASRGWDRRYMVGITLLVGGTMLVALARAFRRG